MRFFSTLLIRDRIRDMPNRHLHGHVLQHHHRLGRLLPLRLIHRRTTLDQLQQLLEHRQLYIGHFGRAVPEQYEPCERVFRVGKNGGSATQWEGFRL